VTTAIDTNVIVALWDSESTINRTAEAALEAAFRRGSLVIAAPVFAELIAAPGRTEEFVGAFLEENGITIDWDLSEAIWRSAARAFSAYAERRRKQRDSGTRRLFVDFIVGAHADVNGYRLLTMDERHYRAAFPGLKLEKI
jgi:predicted nucleic acid-binding protein